MKKEVLINILLFLIPLLLGSIIVALMLFLRSSNSIHHLGGEDIVGEMRKEALPRTRDKLFEV